MENRSLADDLPKRGESDARGLGAEDPAASLLARRPDFQLVRKPVYGNASYAYYNTIKRLVVPRPAIDPARCVHCGLCVAACPLPEKALRFDRGRDRPPRHDYDRCIRCYCCQEMCPEGVISLQTPWLGRLLSPFHI